MRDYKQIANLNKTTRFGLLTWFFISCSAYAASFDCTKARTGVEELICADAELSRLDEDLAEAYGTAIRADSSPAAVRQEQKQWLKTRNGCTDVACLRNEYTTRLSSLAFEAYRNDFNRENQKRDAQAKSIPNSGAFTVVEDDIAASGVTWLFCKTMAENLNSMPNWPPAYCERPHNPAFTNLKPVQWREWTAEEFDKRWHLLAQSVDDSYQRIPARQNDKWTNESTERWREGIRSKQSVVEETILPKNTITSSFQSRRLLRMRSSRDNLDSTQQYRKQKGQQPLPIHNRPEACVLGHFVQLSDDGLTVNTDDSHLSADSPRWQLWLYEVGPGEYRLFGQQWGDVASSFTTGVLTHEAGTCKILYTKPKLFQGVKK